MKIQNSVSYTCTMPTNKGMQRRNNYASSDSTTLFKPAFKGRLNGFKRFLMEIFGKHFVKEAQEVILTKQQKPVSKKGRELAFDGVQRLKNTGVDEENIEAYLKACKGNNDHFNYMQRLRKEGMHEKHIPEVFEACKGINGRLCNELLKASQFMHQRGVRTKEIPALIELFKVNGSKFNKKGFLQLERLRIQALNARINTFSFLSKMKKDEINSLIYKNAPQITETVNLIGEDTFVYLYSMPKKVFMNIIENVPKLNSSNMIPSMEVRSLLRKKINTKMYSPVENHELIEAKIYSLQAAKECMDKIASLEKIIELSSQITPSTRVNKLNKITALLINLPD